MLTTRRSRLAVFALALAAGGATLAGLISAPAGPAPAIAQAGAGGAFAVDGVHTSLVFRIQRLTGAPFYGRFNEIKGAFNLNADKPEASTLDISIPVESVDTNNDGRDKHLRGSDFFSAAEFPTLSFKGREFKKTADNTFEVTGDLTVRGTTKPLTVTLKQTGTGPARGGGEMIGFDTSFSFKRSDFGITYGPQALGDEVTVMLGLEGVRK